MTWKIWIESYNNILKSLAMSLNHELMKQINQISGKENKENNYTSPAKSALVDDEEQIDFLMN